MAERQPYCADRMCGAPDCSTCYGPGDDGDGCEDCGAPYVEDCACSDECVECGEPLSGPPERDAFGHAVGGTCAHCVVVLAAIEAGTMYDHPRQADDPAYRWDDSCPF